MTLRRDNIDAIAIRRRFGHGWTCELLVYEGEDAEDCWVFFGPSGQKVIVSYDPDSEPGVEWVHASVSWNTNYRLPSYFDLKQMHAAVFGDGFAYQCFVPGDKHINIKSNVLHLWGKLDGSPALPDFGKHGTI
jgi:hypothetical protein